MRAAAAVITLALVALAAWASREKTDPKAERSSFAAAG